MPEVTLKHPNITLEEIRKHPDTQLNVMEYDRGKILKFPEFYMEKNFKYQDSLYGHIFNQPVHVIYKGDERYQTW